MQWIVTSILMEHGCMAILVIRIIFTIKVSSEFLVDEDTICQYTGLTDKNGKKIFEGDIVRYGEVCGEVKFGLHESNWQIGKYNQGFFVTFPKEYLLRNELGYWRNKIVVVGNVFDNPELLEEVE